MPLRRESTVRGAARPEPPEPRRPIEPDTSAEPRYFPLGGEPSPASRQTDSATAGRGRPRGASWPALVDAGFPRPDTQLAVGPENVVVVVNPRLAFYSRGGDEFFVADMSEFFQGLTPADYFGDVRVLYDQYSGRFMLSTMASSPEDSLRWVLLAVSDDADAEGEWYKYAIDLRYIDGVDTGHVGDYAGLATGPETVQITADMFPVRGGGFGYAQIVLLPKQPLLDGLPDLTLTYFTDIRNAAGEKVKTIQPARHFGAVATPFFAAHVPFVYDRVEVIAVHDPLGAPYLATATVPCEPWSIPRVVEQKLGPPPYLWAHDDRMLEVCWRDSSLYADWHVHSGSGNVNHQAWVHIDTSGWPNPLLVQEGRAGSETRSNWMGAITVNREHSVALGVSLAGPDDDPAAAYVWRRADDPAGEMRAPKIYAQGGGFLGTNYPSVAEWGDYSGACVDPLDDRTFWFANERAFAEPGEASEEWWIWVCSFTPPDGCAADFNGDGAANTLDVLAFLNAWTGGDPTADFDGDGVINTLDVIAFLNAWNAGCP